MKSKLLSFSIFIISIFCLFISMKLFWNMGVYVDEANTSPAVVLGGTFWLYMNWLRLGFLALISILSAVSFFKKK